MVYSSAIFLFAFFPAAFVLYRLVPSVRGKNLLLLALSLVFYAFGRLAYVPLLLGSILLNWGAGRLLGRLEDKRARRAVGATAVAVNIGAMALFKYLDFVIANLNALLGTAIPAAGIPLPLGISFFTFTAVSYVVEVWRKPANMAESFLDTALYISFFPVILSGPIVPWKTAAPQLRERSATAEDAARGIRRFIVGMAKKLLIADVVGTLVDGLYASGAPDARLAWLGALGYAVQIYFDFAGYSDMAIGLGRCFGFALPENFNMPYRSLGMTDFWKRWHISLTSWFREYVYMPLVMTKPLRKLYKKLSARYGRAKANRLSILIPMSAVWLLTGLWHGAAWHYVLWGLWHGLFCALEGVGLISVPTLKKTGAGRVALGVYTDLVVLVGTVLFRAEDLAQAGRMLAAMFAGWRFTAAGTLSLQTAANGLNIACLAAGIALSLAPPLKGRLAEGTAVQAAGYLGSLALLALCVMAMAHGGFAPGIYLQF